MTSLEALVHEWVDYLRVERGASAHTVSNYRRDALRYVRDLAYRGVASLAEVSVRDIEDYTMRLASGEVTGHPAAASSIRTKVPKRFRHLCQQFQPINALFRSLKTLVFILPKIVIFLHNHTIVTN